MPGPHGELPGRGVLAPETVARMMAPTPESGGIYGLGYVASTLLDGTRLVNHSGGNRGWRGQFGLLPAERR
jgi:hypothetical protein